MIPDDTRNLVDAWARAVAACDVPALERLVAAPLREEVVGRTRAVHAAFAEIQVTPIEVVVEGDRVAWRWRLSGRHVGPLAGLAPSGARTSIVGVNFQRVQGGAVVEHWTTVDLAPLRDNRA